MAPRPARLSFVDIGRLPPAIEIGRAPRWGHIASRRLAPALLALAAAGPCAPALGAQIGLTPAVLELVPDGGPAVASITILTADSSRQSLRVYVEDWDRGPAGENRFSEPGTLPGSCSPHLRVFPDAVTVGPGREARVQVVLDSLPRPGVACWSVVFVESQPAAAPGSIRVLHRVGAKLYGLPATPLSRAARVTRVAVREGPPPSASIEVENTGQAPLEPMGSLEIRSSDGVTLAALPIDPFPILPGARRVLEVPIAAALEPGSYLALAIFDFGAERRVAGQASFEVR